MLEYIATVDINFNSKSVALFDANEVFIKKVELENISDLVKNYGVNSNNTFGIVASVTDSNLKDIPFKHQIARRLLLQGKFLEMPSHYSEKITDERLLNAYYLFNQNTKKKILINANHIMTADIIDNSGFTGGFILPSISQLRNLFKFDEYFKHFTETETMSLEYNNQLPQDNSHAIEQGTLASFYFSIKGIIKEYSPELIYLTGTYAGNIANFLKDTAIEKGISIQLSKDLIHRSLCFTAKRVYR